ncbi:hypothetical protein IPM65_04450 [Candidatus Roizmanbacteria bacterium]|nr:MAG: hypothetical protein IPM65_04450 [Candidatus Roizmanbacteria bacterium]
MNINEVKSFVQEHDWRILMTSLGLAVIATLSPDYETEVVYEVCADHAIQSPASPVPIFSSVSADTQ